MQDFYGDEIDYIHLKFGDMRKAYNFTDEFRTKYPNFCEEYEKYWRNDATCRFKSPLEIAQYVDMFNVPVKFYYNFTDTPSENMADVYEYFIREYGGISNEVDGSWRKDWENGLDGEEKSGEWYKVINITEIGRQMVDALQLTDKQISDMNNHITPEGWTNALMDILENEFGIESAVRQSLKRG